MTDVLDTDRPVMHDHGNGMKWVWIRTTKARDEECGVAGEGIGWLAHKSDVFSLQDETGSTVLIAEWTGKEDLYAIWEKGTKSTYSKRKNVSEERKSLFDEFKDVMMPKLTLQPKGVGHEHLRFWNGDEMWLEDGKYHRIDGPAYKGDSIGEGWFVNGLPHRDDGPAIIERDGSTQWWVNGFLHRLNGPAADRTYGNKEWFINGLRHREDGPAVECYNGDKEWYRQGKLHRDDGPAVIKKDGTQEWYRDGELHREDEPAVIHPNGLKEWYFNGKRHRDDGPAVQFDCHDDDDDEWWIDGKQVPISVHTSMKM